MSQSFRLGSSRSSSSSTSSGRLLLVLLSTTTAVESTSRNRNTPPRYGGASIHRGIPASTRAAKRPSAAAGVDSEDEDNVFENLKSSSDDWWMDPLSLFENEEDQYSDQYMLSELMQQEQQRQEQEKKQQKQKQQKGDRKARDHSSQGMFLPNEPFVDMEMEILPSPDEALEQQIKQLAPPEEEGEQQSASSLEDRFLESEIREDSFSAIDNQNHRARTTRPTQHQRELQHPRRHSKEDDVDDYDDGDYNTCFHSSQDTYDTDPSDSFAETHHCRTKSPSLQSNPFASPTRQQKTQPSPFSPPTALHRPIQSTSIPAPTCTAPATIPRRAAAVGGGSRLPSAATASSLLLTLIPKVRTVLTGNAATSTLLILTAGKVLFNWVHLFLDHRTDGNSSTGKTPRASKEEVSSHTRSRVQQDGNERNREHSGRGEDLSYEQQMQDDQNNGDRQEQQEDEDDETADSVESDQGKKGASGGGWFASLFKPSAGPKLTRPSPSRAALNEQLDGFKQRCKHAETDKATIEREYEKASWQLQETMSELSSLKTTTRHLQAQLADNEEMLARAIRIERRKAKEELLRMKEAMVKVVERERESMRDEFMKQAAELQVLWKKREEEEQQQQQVEATTDVVETPPAKQVEEETEDTATADAI